MGYDMSWEKSVAQILSSKPEFVRVKGTYSLNGNFQFDLSKKTFKDKVINCLVTIPEGKADLKRLVEQYIKIYGQSEGITHLSDERRKVHILLFRLFKLVSANLYVVMIYSIRATLRQCTN